MSLPNIAVLISGRGSNMMALASAIDRGELHARLACVVSNRADAPGLKLAADRQIPTCVLPHQGLSRQAHGRQIREALAPHQISLICLAGFMRLLDGEFIQAYKNQIVNIHPSLLPAFPGLHAQAQAFEYGVKVTGCTVHFVDEELDHGPIIAQTAVLSQDTDTQETLAQRILDAEHRLYPAAVEKILHSRWTIQERRVIFG
ncbi:MAG TPA: phosphoribosylglycinamide formyltransferase [Acidobacteriota bacterium]|nr:phosphoribosylglycinamide formyltransferase [Acidobacteriota bacterium]HMZ78548.1 phosphoribosylglycinamide formyltransferase [Acidobacteriota bacterium]HNB71311.1 phosphoribosylglycinamide formyltransferase [Acidobacteriota bacterium]HNC47156.1 phosphoribosylglycinamide formyltransferase [Acidobacteriota bacterium]HNG93562.1 phosphoribosylglycinamide formyltransferase [Acidobacteriota bacterium]